MTVCRLGPNCIIGGYCECTYPESMFKNSKGRRESTLSLSTTIIILFSIVAITAIIAFSQC